MMQVVCAWCSVELGWRQGGEAGHVSHGICKPCAQRVRVDRRMTAAQKVTAAVVFVLLLLVYGVAGECDRRDEEAYAKVRGEIMASAPSWAVTR